MNNTIDFYKENGYIILKNVIESDLLSAYETFWLNAHSTNGKINSIRGWENSNSFVDCKEILDILCHETIFNFLKELNENFCLHLSFTSWTSTKKGWHQDWIEPSKEDALNYAGVWVALDDIHPDSGPFQFIPKSNQWNVDYKNIYQQENKNKVQELLVKEITLREADTISFLAGRGDLIIWSGHLVHRGSIPVNDNLLRKSLIGHYNTKGHGIEKYKNGLYRNDKGTGVNLYI